MPKTGKGLIPFNHNTNEFSKTLKVSRILKQHANSPIKLGRKRQPPIIIFNNILRFAELRHICELSIHISLQISGLARSGSQLPLGI